MRGEPTREMDESIKELEEVMIFDVEFSGMTEEDIAFLLEYAKKRKQSRSA